MTGLPEKAIRAVELIVDDLTARRGLRQEWEEIDEDMQGKIMLQWVAIIVRECGDIS
jgi:hypothetical protein